MTPVAIEARLQALLAADPVCQGRVSGTTLRALALEFSQVPAPDGDVLAERAACIGVMQAAHARIRDVIGAAPAAISLEARRLAEAIETVRQGLHVFERPPVAEGAAGTDVRPSGSMPPGGCKSAGSIQERTEIQNGAD